MYQLAVSLVLANVVALLVGLRSRQEPNVHGFGFALHGHRAPVLKLKLLIPVFLHAQKSAKKYFGCFLTKQITVLNAS